MKRIFFIVLVLLMFSACENKSKTVLPSHLLTEQEIIAIMTDVQILEADINLHKTNKDTIGNMPEVYYCQLFEHYGITDSIFAENLRYYTYNPETIERIMDSVAERLISSVPQQLNH